MLEHCIMYPQIIVCYKMVICPIALREKFYLNYYAFLNLMNDW